MRIPYGEENILGAWELNVGATTDEFFTSALPPAIGNLSGGSWDFPTDGWYSIEFDDYVVSQSYIGLEDAYEVLIKAPTGLQVF